MGVYERQSLPTLSWGEMFVLNRPCLRSARLFRGSYNAICCILASGLHARTQFLCGAAPKKCCGGRAESESTQGPEEHIAMQDLQTSLVNSDSLAADRTVLAVEPINPGTEVGISIQGLSKNYGEVHAVDGLTVDMYRGEITALLGHNGAGKTTTMQMLSGGVAPTAGDATVLGHSIVHDPDAVQSRVAICPQQNLFRDQMTVKEHAHFADLQRKSVSDEEINELVKKLVLKAKQTHGVNLLVVE